MADETPDHETNSNIIPINIQDEKRGAEMDYSMSVFITPALTALRARAPHLE